VLYLHETHRLRGGWADRFEVAWRERYVEALASTNDARLLWFMHHAHGTGPSYVVVTVTALRDGVAWERFTGRLADGDLRDWNDHVDEMRYEMTSKLLVPVGWSQIQDVDLGAVPVDGSEREQALYMEDTVRPYPGESDTYLKMASVLYARDTLGKRLAEGTSLLELRGCFRTLVGSNAGREVILWQRVVRPELLVPLLTREIPAEHRGPGTWMHDALAYRDTWESRLLRTATWSPLD
jgi:hypothetical protein